MTNKPITREQVEAQWERLDRITADMLSSYNSMSVLPDMIRIEEEARQLDRAYKLQELRRLAETALAQMPEPHPCITELIAQIDRFGEPLRSKKEKKA